MKFICFDMDNTLVRTNHLHLKAFNLAFKKNKLGNINLDIYKKYSGIDKKALIKKIHPKLNNKTVQKVLNDHDYFVLTKTHKHAKIINGVNETLKKLSKKYKLAIVSNCSIEEIVVVLRSAGVNLNLFSLLIGRDYVKHGKPWPDEILKAELLLKVKSGYMVGDSIYDIRAGRKAKVKTIGVLTGHNTEKDFKKEKADFIIKSVKYLDKIL